MIRVTRRYRFPAAHVLRHPGLSDAENREIYGKCAHEAGHGHDYALEVTVGGEVDRTTGRVAPPEVLDAVVGECVLDPLSHTLLNDAQLFTGSVPTAENIARAVYREIAPRIAERTDARIVRVRVVETRRNRFEYGAAV